MQALIPIQHSDIENEQIQTVDARQLHEFLESKQDFSTWIKNRIVNDEYFSQGVDFISLHKNVEQVGHGGHNRKDYALTLDTAKHLSMMERTAKGKQARQYFIECEKVARGTSLPVVEPSRKEDFELELIGAKYAADILRVSDSSKLEMMHIVYENNRVPTKALPQYTEKVKVAYSATHLLKLNNCQLKTRAFNVAMINAGYLEQKERMASKGKMKKYNSLTEKGLKYGIRMMRLKGHPLKRNLIIIGARLWSCMVCAGQ